MPDEQQELSRRLGALADAVSRGAELRDPSLLRRSAERRRSVPLTASVAAVAVGAVSGYAWLDGGTADRGLAPATSPTAGTDPTAPAPSEKTAPRGDWVTAIPVDFRLPHEGEPGWGRNRGGQDMWLLHPCLDIHGGELLSGYPSDDARTDWSTIGRRDVEYFGFEQLGVYPDPETADQAMRQMRRALEDCAAQSADVEGDAQHQHRESFWATKPVEFSGGTQPSDAFHAYNWNRWYDGQGNPTYRLGGPFITVVRVGNAILLVGWDAETDWSAPRAAGRAAREIADQLHTYLPQLCVFGPDGDCER